MGSSGFSFSTLYGTKLNELPLEIRYSFSFADVYASAHPIGGAGGIMF